MTLESTIKVLSILGAVITFAWGVYQYTEGEKLQRETRRIEATKPYLERQLNAYSEAVRSASSIVTAMALKREKDRTASERRFWEIYYGDFALVEDAFTAAAMKAFGDALKQKAPEEKLTELALELARICRNSLATSWGVANWESPQWWKPDVVQQ